MRNVWLTGDSKPIVGVNANLRWTDDLYTCCENWKR